MYNSDDYIGLAGEGWAFYYGYEKVWCKLCATFSDHHKECCGNDDREWCFEFSRDWYGGDTPILIPFSNLGVKDMFDLKACIGAGIRKELNGLGEYLKLKDKG